MNRLVLITLSALALSACGDSPCDCTGEKRRADIAEQTLAELRAAIFAEKHSAGGKPAGPPLSPHPAGNPKPTPTK